MEILIEKYTKVIKKNKVLDNIEMKLEAGKIYGLEGINGSGKTMLMKAIAGLIRPTSGYVKVNEKIVGKDVSFPDNIGILIENPSFVSKYNGFKNLSMLASIENKIGREDIEEMLLKVGLDETDKKSYRKYSLGMKQRLGIACALMENPELILLDEPFNALDQAGVSIVKKLLIEERNQGKLIVISCHDKSILENLSDEIFCMENGHIINHYAIEKKEVLER